MNKRNAVSLLLAITIALASLLSLSSCSIGFLERQVYSAEINSTGELIITYTNGEKDNLGKISNDTTNITVNSEGGDVSAATNAGLVSAVTVTANFTTTTSNGGFFPGFGGSSTSSYSSEGSGVIYKLDRDSGSAFIITNYHVVYDSASNTDDGVSDDIEVYLYGREYTDLAVPATYVGGSLYYDIAVLYVENVAALQSSVYNSVSVADSDELFVGERAIAVGNPEGYGISASLGIVGVTSEYITMTAADEYTPVTFRVIRVDTAVNSGNSGGGLYNDKGELIGIVNAKIVKSTVENIAYAIPSNVACAVADNIIDNCFNKDNKSVKRAIVGVSLGISDSIAVMDEDSGMLKIVEQVGVTEVDNGSPAHGKLKVGDLIKTVTVGGETTTVTRRYHLIDEMLKARVGDTVIIGVERNGKEIEVEINITEDCISNY